MKPSLINLFLLPTLIAGLGLILAGRAAAQTFTTLYTFSAASGSYPILTNSDGASPYGGLTLSGNTLYGTAPYGGTNAQGTVFAVNTDGTGFTNLHTFTGNSGSSPYVVTNSDGANPWAGLILSGNTLYGTAVGGGTNGEGTVFAVNTDGSAFANLHSFPGYPSDGANPWAGLILSGNTLYGTALAGGTNGNGTVFAVNTNGTGFTTLYSFAAGSGSLPYQYTNSDGAWPQAGLILSGNTLYGTTRGGGTNGNGTVFAVNTEGTGFTNLHTFTANSGSSPYVVTNSDGANPWAGLILSGNTLYGTAPYGSTNAQGTVFAVNTDGTGFTNLHIFSALSGSNQTNSDGASPFAGLTLWGNTLYGTAVGGGANGQGTLFAVNTDGTGFTNLHIFSALSGSNQTNSDGASPFAGLTLWGNTLYGTAQSGGANANGTVFSLSLAPQLTITPFGANVVLTWPTNVAGFDYSGFTLQSTTNLVSPSSWITNSPPPVVVNGQNTVTNPISAAQQFFRLIQ
jgi:uncharacterized repeat protein (TIGR03803 family)